MAAPRLHTKQAIAVAITNAKKDQPAKNGRTTVVHTAKKNQAMASYAAAVDNFRSAAAAARAAGGGLEGVAPEDMAAMQALMEEDENNPDAFAMAEDESLDYDVSFRKQWWCTEVLARARLWCR